MPSTSILDAVKIQARALIPVVKALEAELGKEKAHSVVGRAIAESYAEFAASRTSERNTHPGDDVSGGFDYPSEGEVVERTDNAYATNITSCAFAEYFRTIGEPEIGALLTCGVDFAVNDKTRPDWEFTRSQTLMQGAAFCDFRWRRRTRET